MKEIGGYIELDKYALSMLHDGAIALNCGRNALAYLIRAKGIKKILLPYFLCDSVKDVCLKEAVSVKYYSIDNAFLPKDVTLEDDEWLYIVNYYGQINNYQLQCFFDDYRRIIVDNVQAYFQMPIQGVDTLYTCRKFFGVSDGAFLYTDTILEEELPLDESFNRVQFLFGRFDRTASEFYNMYLENEKLFADAPIKKMSKLTNNLLHGINYDFVKCRRTENFMLLHDAFQRVNQLRLSIPEGAYMYPLYISDGAEIRKYLQSKKIYVPTLWPDVLNCCNEMDLEYDMAKNILPLPVDQRYCLQDMKYIVEEVAKCMHL